jgi:tRNA modification GTPase
LELSCHGSPYIQQRLLQALLNAGFRMAEPGEFTMRAFRNGKLDLSQAEAVADLIASESAAGHRLAMQQLRGGFSDEIQELREGLIHFASMIELELDFGEEDVEFANRDDLKALVEKILNRIRHLIESFATGIVVKEGVPVAIVGKPNAGKSTLLNALLNEDRAIVSDIPGTTRDTVEDVTTLSGIRFRFIDTAGLRETTDEIEAIGVERSRSKIAEARIVLYLYDPTELNEQTLEAELQDVRARLAEGSELIVIRNKTDLASPHPEHLSISAKQREGMDALTEALTHSITHTLSTSNTVVTNARHHAALTAAQASLMDVLSGLGNGITGDFLAIDIRKALHHLGEITGEVTHEDLLDFIFSRFCIGK